MTPAAGELVTVAPHRLPHGATCGRFHARTRGAVHDGRVIVQQMRPDGDRWKPGMSTCVFAAAVGPLEVQVDLFGNPAGTP